MKTEAPAIRSGADLETGARFMLFWNADRIEVRDVDTGRPLGTVTEHDIVRLVAKRGVDIIATIDEALPDPGGTSAHADDLLAQDVMSNPVLAIREHASLEDLAGLLYEREISGLPVLDDHDELVGVVSERDLVHAVGDSLIRLALRRAPRTGPFLRAPHLRKGDASTVGDVMTTPALSVHPDTPLRTVAEMMVVEEVNRLPVVRDRRLIGIVTRGDVLAAIGHVARQHDREIHPPIVLGAARPHDANTSR